MTFCTICNAGGSFRPEVNSEVHTFSGAGVYDGMLLLRDKETNSRWNHINGKYLYGKNTGRQLTKLAALNYINVEQCLERFPKARLAVPMDDPNQVSLDDMSARLRESLELCGEVPVQDTFGAVDQRCAKLEMGLGVWTDNTHRFYRLGDLFRAHNVVVDHFDNRTLVVYVEPSTTVPLAFFVDIDFAEWRNDVLHLSNGNIRNTIYYGSDGKVQMRDYPYQLFARWYSFAFTFPSTDVYGGRTM